MGSIVHHPPGRTRETPSDTIDRVARAMWADQHGAECDICATADWDDVSPFIGDRYRHLATIAVTELQKRPV